MELQNHENITQIQGKLIVRPFGKFSKEDNVAFYLKTKEKIYFLLMLKGEEPFKSEKLKRLKNKLVLLKGKLSKYIFFANSITELSSHEL